MLIKEVCDFVLVGGGGGGGRGEGVDGGGGYHI